MEPLAQDAQRVSELLTELDGLAAAWHRYVHERPTADQFSREAGYLGGLKLCADQLTEIMARNRAYAEI